MHRYDHSYDEACSEAHEIINEWMSEKLRDELQSNDTSTGAKWHEDSDAFLERFLSSPTSNNKHQASHQESDINIYGDDEAVAVDRWMNNLSDKLNSFSLSDYEANEKKKKPVAAKDPRLAMEVRQQKVKEARIRRENQLKLKAKKNIEKKQNDVIAREIVKQEAAEKARKKKMEEEAIQREMAKIRKQMLGLKKKHEAEFADQKEEASLVAKFISPRTSTTSAEVATSRVVAVAAKHKADVSSADLKEQSFRETELLANVRKFEAFQKQKRVRKCLHHWIKIVLSKRAAMGKAKAMADWRLILRTWSAWRKYYFEQIVSKEVQLHQNHMKQMQIHVRVASSTHRQRLLKKCFDGWKKFVKVEQYSKELLKEQEETKRKMDALLGAVTSKAVSVKNDLVLQAVDDEDVDNNSFSTHAEPPRKESGASKRSTSDLKSSTPKHAWQVRRSDVHKLTLKQIEDMGSVPPHAVTRVKPLKGDSSRVSSSNSRALASKQVITKQREMISHQKQIIAEQQRKLLEREAVTETESVVSTSSADGATEVSKVKIFQPPRRPKSLLAMEKRAEERLKRREEFQERKRQLEKERIENLKAEEEEQRKLEEEDKKRKQEELKRMKQMEIEKENERKAFIAKMQLLRRKAEEHYKKTILRKHGLNPWLKLKQIHDEKLERARCHYETNLSGNVLMSWFVFQRDDTQLKRTQADRLYSRLLKRRCLQNWLKYGEAMSILEKKADLHRNKCLKGSYLIKWERYVIDEKMAYFKKEEMAVEHNRKRLLRRGFQIIRVHKLSVKREELRLQRIADMRRKVAQLLPDFEPESSVDNF